VGEDLVEVADFALCVDDLTDSLRVVARKEITPLEAPTKGLSSTQ